MHRFGALRLAAQRLLDRWVLAGPSGRWMRVARHHVDGLAYGGLLGTAVGLIPLLGPFGRRRRRTMLKRLVAIARGDAGDTLRRAVLEPRRLAMAPPSR